MAWDSNERIKAMYMVPIVFVAFFLLSIVWCCLVKRGGIASTGERAVLPGLGALMAGGALIYVEGLDLVGWLFENKIELFDSAVYGISTPIFGYIEIVCGAVGGITLLVLGLLWIFGAKTDNVFVHFFMLAPALWATGRVAKYTQSYISTVRVPFTFTTAIVLILNATFLFLLARQHFGRGKSTFSGATAAVCLMTAVADIAITVSTYILLKLNPTFAGLATHMVNMTDLCVGIFALLVLIYMYTTPAFKAADHLDAIVKAQEKEKEEEKTEDSVNACDTTNISENKVIETVEESTEESPEIPTADPFGKPGEEV